MDHLRPGGGAWSHHPSTPARSTNSQSFPVDPPAPLGLKAGALTSDLCCFLSPAVFWPG